MNFRSIIMAGERARQAALLAEEDHRERRWEDVRVIAHRAATRGPRGDHGWHPILIECAQLEAPGDRSPSGPIERGSRIIVRRAALVAATGDAIGAGWDRALAEHSDDRRSRAGGSGARFA